MSKRLAMLSIPLRRSRSTALTPALVHDQQPSPWDNLKFDVEGTDEARRKFATLYNT